MDNSKRKLICQVEGSRTLEDAIGEKVATLLAKGTERSEVIALVGIGEDALAVVEGEALYQRRLAYLTAYYAKKNRKATPPESLDEYQDFAMKQLWRLARGAKTDKDRVSACRCIVENVTDLRKQPKGKIEANVDTSALAKLRGSK